MRPYRTFLFFPAHRDGMPDKALASEADALLPDLEDSVPPGMKDAARETLHRWLGRPPARPVFARVNALATGHTERDLEAVVTPGLEGVFLPKVESADEVRQAGAWLDRLERAAGVRPGAISLVAMLESARGVLRAHDVAVASPRVASICCAGGENGDLQADLGCDWSLEGTEMLYARSKVVLDARAAGLEYLLDGAYMRLGDDAGLAVDTRLSKRLGYTGRTIVHPRQARTVNEIYALGAAEAMYCTRLLAAFEAAVVEGRAAVDFEGRLVDTAMAAWARRRLARARSVAE